jgi:hypothetical protein
VARNSLIVALLCLLASGVGQARTVRFVFEADPPDAIVEVNVNGQVPAARVQSGVAFMVAQPRQIDVHARRDGYQPYAVTLLEFPEASMEVPVVLEPASWSAWLRHFRHAILWGGCFAGVFAMLWRRCRQRARARIEHALGVRDIVKRSTDDLAGHTIGAWRLTDRLGAGGMGAVYRAVPDATLDASEAVAVKLLHPEIARDPLFKKVFEQEIRACMQLSHPHVVRLIDWGEEEGLVYMVSELLSGRTLRQALRDEAWSEARARELWLALVETMAYVHARGVTHRDLKPSNVMLCADGRVKILDFGLATSAGSPYVTMGGTPGYMAPEQAEGSIVEARADQYALGVMARDMLERVSGAQARSTMAMVAERMCAPVAEQRYASLQDVLEALQADRPRR